MIWRLSSYTSKAGWDLFDVIKTKMPKRFLFGWKNMIVSKLASRLETNKIEGATPDCLPLVDGNI